VGMMSNEIIEQLNELKDSIEKYRGLNQNSNALAFDISMEEQ
jgi:hypothetical protein